MYLLVWLTGYLPGQQADQRGRSILRGFSDPECGRESLRVDNWWKYSRVHTYFPTIVPRRGCSHRFSSNLSLRPSYDVNSDIRGHIPFRPNITLVSLVLWVVTSTEFRSQPANACPISCSTHQRPSFPECDNVISTLTSEAKISRMICLLY